MPPEIGNLQAVAFEILPDASTTALTSDTNPQISGSKVKFTATVTPGAPGGHGAVAPTGTVYFYDGSKKLGSSTLALNGSNYQATYETSYPIPLTAASGSLILTAIQYSTHCRQLL
jgi:hypothetical protein